jgi:hypothetical protein
MELEYLEKHMSNLDSWKAGVLKELEEYGPPTTLGIL